MGQETVHYLAYLLRLWRTRGDPQTPWQASLEEPRTRRRFGFAGLEALFEFLRQMTQGDQEPDSGMGLKGTDREGAGERGKHTMPFFVIQGTFHIRGYSPDGDSIRFQAKDEGNWANLSSPPVGLNARRHAQLRLEAIDTLETHYRNSHQPLALANAALQVLLEGLGITGMEHDALWTTVNEAQDGTEGYIISRVVEKNQRPVAFVYAGTPPEQDGSKIFLTVDRMRHSVNYHSLEVGLAYPTYYKGLFPDLRHACTEAAQQARGKQLGVWAEDRTNAGFTVEGLESIEERYVILPKLFRRLVQYLEGGGPVAGFKESLEAQAEQVLIISTGHFTHLDTLVETNGDLVKLTEPPENLMFMG